ncbi:MAG: alpha/beta fold hydrolase [Gammaproteobacteria bacterium]|nr:alpha/beta fold hydrolase [Gammaproteobacteria bacterium]
MSKRSKIIAVGVYMLVLIASHVYQSINGGMNDALLPGADRPSVEISNRGHDGAVIADDMLEIVYQEWGKPTNIDPDTKTPVLLMHGAPGMGTDFARIGDLLTGGNRAVYSPDLIGFAQSDMGENVSYRVQARHMFSFLDSMGVDRVHLVGWSNGGGVGLRMADLDPDRIASLTMLASVGAQETEGSGSYFFEHVKYAVGLGAIGFIPDLIPHFGVLGTRDLRIGWLWSFWDSDQRELTRIMPTITTPVMVLHGRDDPLVPAWGAELHHEMMPSSKLVMLDASHFLPFMQAQETAGYLNAFFDRHDQAHVAPETGYLNLAPVPDRHGTDGLLHKIAGWIQGVPWWVQLIAVVILVRYCTTVGLAVVMLFTSMMSIDFGVAILGMMLGRSWWLIGGAHRIDRPFYLLGWVRGVAYVLGVFIVGLSGGGITVWLTEHYGIFGFMIGFLAFLGVLSAMRLIVTWEGRQRLKGEFNRITNHEYWVTGLVYLPMLWWGVKRMIARRWLIELTSVNPGYAHDAGIMCESKMDINRKLGDGSVDDDAVLHCALIEEGSEAWRINHAIEAVKNDDQLGGYPVFCKPDQGERGRAVEMIRSESELIAYCHSSDESFVIQQRHTGAMEVGVLWVRHIESITNAHHNGPSGFIYAITIKHFPFVVGDGKRSIRRLILGNKRYRAQSRMFLTRMSKHLNMVPDAGEEIALGIAGNHSQGAMFTDGAHLITDELSARIGEIVDRFVDDQGRGFDIGRFDLRCESLEELAKGKGFGIVELNGLTSEPTNLYDPKRSIFWAWDMLSGYWMHAERIGAARLETKTGETVDKETWKKIRGALVRVMFT